MCIDFNVTTNHRLVNKVEVAGSVVGNRIFLFFFRVKSISGVRIMDASILPSPISLYPNSVLVAMAEKAADLIKNANKF